MFSKSNSNLLVCLLIKVLIISWCNAEWKASSSIAISNSQNITLYSRAEIPRYAFSKTPIKQNYYIYYPYVAPTIDNICADQTAMNFLASKNSTCADYFCTRNSSLVSFATAAQRKLHVQLQNFCLYCSNAPNTPDFFDLLYNYAACPYFIPIHTLDCKLKGNPLLASEMFEFLWGTSANTFIPLQSAQALNESTATIYTVSVASSTYNITGETRMLIFEDMTRISYKTFPIVCYCKDWNRYGVQCDGYTAFYNEWTFVWRFLVTGPIFFIYLLIAIFTLVIPECGVRCSKWYRSGRHEKCSRLKIFFSERNHMIANLVIGICLELVESVTSFVMFMQYSYDLPTGVFRVLSGLVLVMSYSSLLVQWIKISEKLQRSNEMSIKHKYELNFFQILFTNCEFLLLKIICFKMNRIILAIMYAYVIGSIIACGVVFLFTNMTIALMVGSGCIGLYALMFPVPLNIYGLKMYCALRISKGIAQFKFTRFVMLASVIVVLDGVVLIIGVVNFFIAWDAYGLFWYLTRDIVFDILVFVTVPVLMWVAYNKKYAAKVYWCCKNVIEKV